jgi:hypothetical protein
VVDRPGVEPGSLPGLADHPERPVDAGVTAGDDDLGGLVHVEGQAAPRPGMVVERPEPEAQHLGGDPAVVHRLPTLGAGTRRNVDRVPRSR